MHHIYRNDINGIWYMMIYDTVVGHNGVSPQVSDPPALQYEFLPGFMAKSKWDIIHTDIYIYWYILIHRHWEQSGIVSSPKKTKRAYQCHLRLHWARSAQQQFVVGMRMCLNHCKWPYSCWSHPRFPLAIFVDWVCLNSDALHLKVLNIYLRVRDIAQPFASI